MQYFIPFYLPAADTYSHHFRCTPPSIMQAKQAVNLLLYSCFFLPVDTFTRSYNKQWKEDRVNKKVCMFQKQLKIKEKHLKSQKNGKSVVVF